MNTSMTTNSEVSVIPTPEEMNSIQLIAKVAADSKYFEKLGGVPAIFAISLYAREVGVPILTALMGGFTSVQGRITMSAELMNMLIRRKGHKLSIVKQTNEICEIQGERSDTKEKATATFTIAEARAAGLVKSGGAWEKYPSDMLFARCISRLKRRLFPDVATMAYVDGEIEPAEENKPSQTIEATTVEPIQEKVQTVSKEQALELEEMIGDDKEYRHNLLGFLRIADFSELPLSRHEKIFQAVIKHNQKRIEEEMAQKPIKEGAYEE